jgi:hypothetical protein
MLDLYEYHLMEKGAICFENLFYKTGKFDLTNDTSHYYI